jgi:septal ring factor EnvC (AmiA/AmiB activator)
VSRLGWACALLAVTLCPRPALAVASQEALEELDRRHGHVLREVQALDRKMAAAERELQAGESLVRTLMREQAEAESARARAQAEYGRAEAAWARRLGALLRAPPTLKLELLAGAGSLTQALDATRLLTAVARHDRRLWAAFDGAKQELYRAIEVLDERARAITEGQARRRALRDELAARRRKKATWLQSLQDRRQRVEEELAQAEAELGALVAPRQRSRPRPRAGRIESLRGKLPWPARGRLRTAFGELAETTYQTVVPHHGWDIAAPAGADVQAIAEGRVAYADWLHGYGQVAIVEHAGGYHTVHAHLGRLAVKPGQRVAQGALLGAVGDTGSLRGTLLYFEVRHRGLPINPASVLARRPEGA